MGIYLPDAPSLSQYNCYRRDIEERKFMAMH